MQYPNHTFPSILPLYYVSLLLIIFCKSVIWELSAFETVGYQLRLKFYYPPNIISHTHKITPKMQKCSHTHLTGSVRHLAGKQYSLLPFRETPLCLLLQYMYLTYPFNALKYSVHYLTHCTVHTACSKNSSWTITLHNNTLCNSLKPNPGNEKLVKNTYELLSNFMHYYK